MLKQDLTLQTMNYECISIEIPLPKGKDEKVIGPIKDELDKKNYDKICPIKSKNLQTP